MTIITTRVPHSITQEHSDQEKGRTSQSKEIKMKVIPILRCNNLKESIHFYTIVLDFTLKYPEARDNDWVQLINDDVELFLTSTDGTPKIPVMLRVDNVDALFKKYISRGLIVPNNPNSPVHSGPIDQSWGLREFYVDDPGGNTLRFAASIA